MKKSTATILTIVGVVVCVGMLGVAFAAWMFVSNVERSTTDEQSATAAFDEARARFAGATPVFELLDDEEAVVRRPPPSERGQKLNTMRVIVWDPDEGNLVRVNLPYWLLRLKSGPIEVISDARSGRGRRLDITIEQLESYGPALLIDHEGRHGERVIVWQE